jgi:ABC-type dipeptide/oligopeptide/nickel transport system permease component
MLAFIVRRLLALPLVLLALSLAIVGLLQFLTPEQRAVAFVQNEQQLRNLDKVIREKGLDQPFWVQYSNWLKEALRGNLGFSRASNKSVVETIKERFPATLELALFASVPIIVIGIWLGTLAALRKDSWLDQLARVFVVVAYNVPTFVMGILLLVVFYGFLGLAPGPGQLSPENQIALILNPVPRRTGMLSVDALLAGNWPVFLDVLRHLILPVITLTTVSSATLLKVTRSSMLEVLSQDYIRTARAKGLPDRVVNLKHARRNALLPVITLASFTVMGLLSGAVITETIFAYPGIGSWGAQAATLFDVPGIMGFAILTAIVTVVVNLATDILYALVDPRVRYD